MGVALFRMPVPYLVASPGIALNTLGDHDDEPIIQVDGRESFQHDEGGLAMVTVQYVGGPSHRIDLLTALSGWIAPTQAVLPEEAVFPPGRTVEEVSEDQTLMMDSSQKLAVAAALGHMDIEYSEVPVVRDVPEDMPANGVLTPEDVLMAVDGEPVDGQDDAAERIRDREPGDAVEITVNRDGESEELSVPTVDDGEGNAVIGILIDSDMEFPFDVDISVGDIGGPSAGMMFSLGIIDRLSEESITGDHYVAGTGTITPQGEVGGVSGVAQKMVSAERQGAEYFLVAEESCPQTLESAARDIQAVPVETLDDATDSLAVIRDDGDTDALPTCQ